MRQKILTLQTIESMIPLIQRIADDIESAYAHAASALDAHPGTQTDGTCEDHPPRVNEALDELQRLVTELEGLGGTLRAYEPVRVDLLAEVDGEIGYVCWESGDTEPLRFHGARENCTGLVLNA